MNDTPLAQKYDFEFGAKHAENGFESTEELRQVISDLGGEQFEKLAEEVSETVRHNRPKPLEDIVSWHGVIETAYSLEKKGSYKDVNFEDGFGERTAQKILGGRE